MSNLCVNIRIGTWGFQVERDFPFRMTIKNSAWWQDKYRDGPQPVLGLYNVFGWRASE